MEEQPKNLTHGVKLQDMLADLVEAYGWDGLGERIKVRCFLVDPSVNSSLKFLRKTPWARTKVEELYVRLAVKKKRRQEAAEKATQKAAEAQRPAESDESLEMAEPAVVSPPADQNS